MPRAAAGLLAVAQRWPAGDRRYSGSGRPLGPRKPVQKGPGVLLKDPGVLLKDPGVLLKNPGVLLKEPGVPLKDPGVLLKDPGVLLKDPGVLLKDPGALSKDPGVLLKDPGVLSKDPGVLYWPAGALGCPWGPGNPSKRWGAKPSTLWTGFRGHRAAQSPNIDDLRPAKKIKKNAERRQG